MRWSHVLAGVFCCSGYLHVSFARSLDPTEREFVPCVPLPQDKENQDQSQAKKENQVVQNQIQEKEKQVVLVLDRILVRKIEGQLVQYHQEEGVSLEELQKILKAVVLVLHLCGVRVLRRNNKNLKSKSQSLINKTLKQNLLKYCKKLKKNKCHVMKIIS